VNKPPLRTRLAPTPSGLLHPGNGLSFVMTWVIARANEGRILLRIDDIDKERCREEYVADIFRTLEWLGLDYDEGPSGVADFFQNWSQETRLGLYENALRELQQQDLLFACTCSRKDIRLASEDGSYPGTCLQRDLPFEGDKARSWRTREHGHFVLRRKNGRPAYQLVSLIDDEHFGINYIVRGADLLGSTEKQRYLARLMGKTPFLSSSFWHHPLLTDAEGQKLSKSQGAGSLQEWRTLGRSPAELYQRAADMLGIPGKFEAVEPLLKAAKKLKVLPMDQG
jgi:glutamyl-tRNA synthetase